MVTTEGLGFGATDCRIRNHKRVRQYSDWGTAIGATSMSYKRKHKIREDGFGTVAQ